MAKGQSKYAKGMSEALRQKNQEIDRLRRSNAALLEACKTTLHWLRNRPADEVIPLVSRIVAAIKEAENG